MSFNKQEQVEIRGKYWIREIIHSSWRHLGDTDTGKYLWNGS